MSDADDSHDGDRVASPDMIDPEFHESGMFLWFSGNRDRPYWFASKLAIEHADGYHETTVELGPDAEPCHVELKYDPGGIAPRAHDPVDSETLYQIRLEIGGLGQKQATFQIHPRFPTMRGPDGDELSIPWYDDRDGVAVQVQPTIIGLDEVDQWLREGLRAVAHDLGVSMNLDYFQNPDVVSRLTGTERYVRLGRDPAKKLTREDGILHDVTRLLGSTEGTEGEYHWDNEGVVGRYHSVSLDPASANELIPGHEFGKEIKCYHPKHVRSEESDDDAMSYPVLRVGFTKAWNDGDSVQWDRRDDVIRELDELLINLLDWAGVPSEPDPTTFQPDDHFGVAPRDDDLPEIQRRADPTPEIEAEQDQLLVSVWEGVNESTRDTLRAVTDGGPQHWTEIKRQTGQSKSNIYRSLNKLSGVLESDNGRFQFSSPKIREEITGLVENIDDMLDSATRRLERLARVELKSRVTGALDRWLKKWGAQIDGWHDDGNTVVRFDDLFNMASPNHPTLSEVLQDGYEAWIKSGRDGQEFDEFRVRAETVYDPGRGKIGALRAG